MEGVSEEFGFVKGFKHSVKTRLHRITSVTL